MRVWGSIWIYNNIMSNGRVYFNSDWPDLHTFKYQESKWIKIILIEFLPPSWWIHGWLVICFGQVNILIHHWQIKQSDFKCQGYHSHHAKSSPPPIFPGSHSCVTTGAWPRTSDQGLENTKLVLDLSLSPSQLTWHVNTVLWLVNTGHMTRILSPDLSILDVSLSSQWPIFTGECSAIAWLQTSCQCWQTLTF